MRDQIYYQPTNQPNEVDRRRVLKLIQRGTESLDWRIWSDAETDTEDPDGNDTDQVPADVRFHPGSSNDNGQVSDNNAQ